MNTEKSSISRSAFERRNQNRFDKIEKQIIAEMGRAKNTGLAILRVSKTKPQITIPELVEETKLRKQTITNAVKKMVSLKIMSPLTEKKRYQVYCYNNVVGYAPEMFLNDLKKQNKAGVSLDFVGKTAAIAQTEISSKVQYRGDAWHNKRQNNQYSKNSLYVADNMDVMKHLIKKGKTFHIIFADAPFNQTTAYKTREYEDVFDQHAGYLQFMYPRLMLCKKLLADTGLVVIAIGEDELYHTKLILNEILGESNFINSVTVETGCVAGVYSGYSKYRLPSVKQYQLLVFAKDHTKINFLNRLYDLQDKKFAKDYNTIITEDLNHEPLIDYLKKIDWVVEEFANHKMQMTLTKVNDLMEISQRFETFIYEEVAPLLYKSTAPFQSTDIQEAAKNQPEDVVFVSDDKRYLIKTKDNTVREFKPFINRVQEDGLGIQRGDIWKGFQMYKNSEKNKFGITFEGRKQIRMLQDLLHWINNKNARVLDIFAGSGSMGAAVLAQNLKDDGKRTFCLVQIPEKINEKSNNPQNFKTIDQKTVFALNNAIKEFDSTEGYKVFRIKA